MIRKTALKCSKTTAIPNSFSMRPSVVQLWHLLLQPEKKIATDFFFIWFLFGLRIRDISPKLRSV